MNHWLVEGHFSFVMFQNLCCKLYCRDGTWDKFSEIFCSERLHNYEEYSVKLLTNYFNLLSAKWMRPYWRFQDTVTEKCSFCIQCLLDYNNDLWTYMIYSTEKCDETLQNCSALSCCFYSIIFFIMKKNKLT